MSLDANLQPVDRHKKNLDLLLHRVRAWLEMRPGQSRSNYWDLRVNHVLGDWIRGGRVGADTLAGGELAWLITQEQGLEPVLEEKPLVAAPGTETVLFHGTLEIDAARGVIYFHDNATNRNVLRICGLNAERMRAAFGKNSPTSSVDITMSHGAQYTE